MRVYFLSGLGADETVFQMLALDYCEPVFIPWIQPQHNEGLKHYALRLMQQCGIPADATIAGLSFGGMLATEIAKAFPKTKVVLLSSSKTRHELPFLYKLGKYLPIYKWPPNAMQRLVMRLLEKRFGVKSAEGKKIYRGIVNRADIAFNDWAMWAILHWDNDVIPPNIFHIHGNADKILPARKVKADIIVKNGGHLMVMENAGEISEILRKYLTT